MTDVQEVLFRLGHSPFRGRIHLRDKELNYLRKKGMREVLNHVAEFIEKRPTPAHPVFVAQHATATRCRECLQKWHQIPKGNALTAGEQGYMVEVIGAWLSQQERVPTKKRSVQGGRRT